jgi:hypothetical protein
VKKAAAERALSPVSPFDPVSYRCGVLPIEMLNYALASHATYFRHRGQGKHRMCHTYPGGCRDLPNGYATASRTSTSLGLLD